VTDTSKIFSSSYTPITVSYIPTKYKLGSPLPSDTVLAENYFGSSSDRYLLVSGEKRLIANTETYSKCKFAQPKAFTNLTDYTYAETIDTTI
jgi:hypothetical protein